MSMAKGSAWHDGESQPVGGLGSVQAQPVTSGAQRCPKRGASPVNTRISRPALRQSGQGAV